ncbi:MAG: hypothetical protein Q7S01_02015 [bacterium]|nr:hypothetical protein [bacterium]
MHNYNNKYGGHKAMLWMMVPCLLLIGFLFFGGEKLFSSGYLWLIILGVCVVPHVWMMWKGHGGRGFDGNSKAAASEQADTESHEKGGCCH